MERISIGESNNVKILGRTTYTEEKLNLFWTASGIELDTPATEMYIDVETDFEKYEPWVEIYVDGELSQKRMVDKGVSRIYILRKMDPGKVRNIRFIKCTQPHPSDKREMFRILGIGADVDPVPMKRRPVRIEFIGDMIAAKFNPCKIYFHSQYYIKDMYAKMGFIEEGEIFEEAGIKHIKMYKNY